MRRTWLVVFDLAYADLWDLVRAGPVFQYSSVHSVAEVSAADHGACSASNPLRSYRDQSTTIALTRPGTRYFICGASGHCASGMKLAVTVSSVSGSNVTTPAPGARLAKPSNPGREAPSDTTPADAAPAVTTTKSSSNTSGASAASGAHVASALLFGAVGLLALLMG